MASETEAAERNLKIANIDPASIYSVTEISKNIRQVLSATPQFNDILIKGEISNFKQAASGHIYFNLRDENCAIACSFFRQYQAEDHNDLGDGVQAVAMGSLMIYEPKSQYQLNVRKIIPIGDGISSLKLKRLKDNLEAEGLFSQDRKKPIPILPRKVGIVTSKDSAAIKDIFSVINLRCQKMDLVIAYAALQGNGAPQSIIQALKCLNDAEEVDTIILTRGGGPSEDFMAFNDEELVRSIVSSTKSIVTGIGHEEDMCLADMAADLRVSTPTAAARAAVPDIEQLKDSLNLLAQDLERTYWSYMHAFDAKEQEAQATREELQRLRIGLNALRANLDRSYRSYFLGLKIKETEVEIVKKEEKAKKTLEDSRSDLIKYRAAILALATILLVVVLIFLLRG